MDYYSFFRFLRNIIYNLKSITKYLCFCFLIIAFIIVCLLLMSCKSYAVQITDYLPQTENQFKNLYFPDLPDGYSFSTSKYVLTAHNFEAHIFIVPDNVSQFYCISANSNNFVNCVLRSALDNNASTINFVHYYINANVRNFTSQAVADRYSWVLTTAPSQYTTWGSAGSYIYSTIDLYYNNLTLGYEAPVSFVAPYLGNMSNQTEEDALISGQFTYFVVQPGDIPKTSDILMDVYDTTNSDSADNIVARYTLNANSPFIIESETYDSGYAYFLTARFLDWFQVVNGKSYKIKLSWVDPDNSLLTNSVEYSWTMSLTAEQQTTEEQTTQQQINQGISNINDTLNDKSFNESDIINKLPTPPTNEDITENGFNNIFNTLRQTFTTNSDLSLVFHVPFSNQDITIPANLTENIVPDIIKNLIRLVYWYLISRFIVKDIASYIEKAKNGTITEGTDTNIKTDML